MVAELDRQYQLVRLDDFRASVADLENGLKTLRQTLDVEKKAHNASIEAAKADLDKARYDLKTIPVQSAIVAEQLKLAEQESSARYKELLSEVKPKDESQNAEWRLNTLEHEQAKIELGRAEKKRRAHAGPRADRRHHVMSSTWRAGEFGQIQAGDELHAGMMFMKVVDPGSMIITATINQADIETIRVGYEARVRFDAYPDLELPARVYSIGAMPNTGGFRTSYVKAVPVVLKIEKLDPRVIPDLSVAVDVVLSAEPAGVLAPLEGIFTDAPGGPAYVFVGSKGGWERREVEIGLDKPRRRGGPLRLAAGRSNCSRAAPTGEQMKPRLGKTASSRKKKAIVLAVVLVIASAGAYVAWRYAGTKEVVIATAKVRRGEFIISILSRGEIRSTRSVILSAPQVPSSAHREARRGRQADQEGRRRRGVRHRPAGTDLSRALDRVRTADSQIVETKASNRITDEMDAMNQMQAGYNVDRAKLDASKAEILSEIEGAKNRIDVGVSEGDLRQVQVAAQGAQGGGKVGSAAAR